MAFCCRKCGSTWYSARSHGAHQRYCQFGEGQGGVFEELLHGNEDGDGARGGMGDDGDIEDGAGDTDTGGNDSDDAIGNEGAGGWGEDDSDGDEEAKEGIVEGEDEAKMERIMKYQRKLLEQAEELSIGLPEREWNEVWLAKFRLRNSLGRVSGQELIDWVENVCTISLFQ